jgi:membrane protein DedA with SNARE-associated domain
MTLLAAGIFTGVFHFWKSIDPLHWVQGWMSTDGGYWVLFGLLFSCGLGMPLPEDIPLLLAGYFVGDGKMNLALAAIAGWCGIITGDCMLYLLGWWFGLNVTRLPVLRHHISVARIEMAHGLFEKYGVWVVAVGRLFAGIRGAMVVTAGTLRFNFIKFIIADSLAAVVSGGLFLYLGFWAHHKFGDISTIEAEVRHYQRYVLLAAVLIAVTFMLWKWKKNRSSRGFDLQVSTQTPITKPE